MKTFTLATALLGASAVQVETGLEAESASQIQSQIDFKAELNLHQLISDELHNGGKPYAITVPKVLKTDKEGQEKLAVQSKAPNYKFDWKFVCAFTKWTPSNQFLHAGKKYDPKTMTLSRFGFIGAVKQCFWGMTGVHWLKPLKVDQILSKGEKEKPVVKATAPQKLQLKSMGERRIHLEDERDMTIGFGGKEHKGVQIMQTEKDGQSGDIFLLQKITAGTYKDMYVLRDVMMQTLVSVYKKTYANNQWLTQSDETGVKTQIWKITDPNAETTISDPSGTWCFTRFDVKGTKALELDSSAQTAPKYTSDVQLMKCNKSAAQYWFMTEKGISKERV